MHIYNSFISIIHLHHFWKAYSNNKSWSYCMGVQRESTANYPKIRPWLYYGKHVRTRNGIICLVYICSRGDMEGISSEPHMETTLHLNMHIVCTLAIFIDNVPTMKGQLYDALCTCIWLQIVCKPLAVYHIAHMLRILTALSVMQIIT